MISIFSNVNEGSPSSPTPRSVGYIENVHASGTKAQVLHLVQKAVGASTAVNKPASALAVESNTPEAIFVHGASATPSDGVSMRLLRSKGTDASNGALQL